MKTKLGVVLSGCGAKGAYEAGFLKCLAELKIQPDAISGTSIGALNGAVYAAQKETGEVSVLLESIWQRLARSKALTLKKRNSLLNFVDIAMFFSPLAPVSKVVKVVRSLAITKSVEGVCSTDLAENILDQYAPVDQLKEGLPFYVGVTESDGNLLDTLRLLGLSSSGVTDFVKVQSLERDEVHKVILASAALPIAFDAVQIGDKHYRDGCLGSIDNEWGNTPAKPLITEEKCTHLIVCHLNEGSFFNRYDPVFSDVSIIEVRPKNGIFSSPLDPLMFSPEKIFDWMEQGYQDSKRILNDALEALQGKQQRVASERRADDAVERLKSKQFFIPN